MVICTGGVKHPGGHTPVEYKAGQNVKGWQHFPHHGIIAKKKQKFKIARPFIAFAALPVTVIAGFCFDDAALAKAYQSIKC